MGVIATHKRVFYQSLVLLFVTSCNSEGSGNSTQPIPQVVQTTIATPDRYTIVRNDSTTAEAAAALGCIGDSLSAPVNLQQFDDSNPTFEDLYYVPGRPWLVKLEEAGVASGRLSWGPDADEAFIERQVRDYDMPSEAFTVAAFLDPRWSTLSTIWRESLSYGLERVNAGQKEIDAAYEVLTVYGAELESMCKMAIEGALQQALALNLPTSTYLYIQTANYLIDWHPESFTSESLDKFVKQWDIQES